MSEEVINLPYGYKQCLFLESTGMQYINTNYVATNNTGAYVKWSLTNIKNYSNVLTSLGISIDDTADSVFMLPHWNGINNAYLSAFMSRSENALRLENQTAPTLYSIHESRLNYYNSSEVYIDTTLMGNVDNVSENIENDLPLYLFGCNKLNVLSTADSMIGRIYRATITEGEEVAIDLIPCLDDKGKPCMYDLISQTPFYNANAEGNDFKYVVKGKIPSWYKRVEYLESTATSGFGIDTGIKGSNNVEFSIKFNCLYSGTGCILGSRISSTRNEIQVSSHNNGIFRMGNINYNIPFSINAIHEASLVDGKYILDDTVTTVDVGNWKNDFNIHLFVLNESNNLTQGSRSKIYFCKLYENKELVRDFVPCLDENSVPCMFDLVEGIPYYNIGSGEFLYNKNTYEGSYTGFGQLSGIGNRLGGGTDGLPPAYTRVNYLESTGTQYMLIPEPWAWDYTKNTSSGVLLKGLCKKSSLQYIYQGCLWGVESVYNDWYDDIPGEIAMGIDGTPTDGRMSYHGKTSIGINTTDFFIAECNYKNSDKRHVWNNVEDTVEDIAFVQLWQLISAPPSEFQGLFCLYNSSTNTIKGKVSGIIHWVKMSQGEEITRDLIPCLDDNGRPCMFDRVSRTTFYNSGTGEFLYG